MTGHLFDWIVQKGISIKNITDAVQHGIKTLNKDGTITAENRWHRVVYRQFILANNDKLIYPIEVIENDRQ
jgi:hypothetical protein